jgi:biotin transport system substrate-specific component
MIAQQRSRSMRDLAVRASLVVGGSLLMALGARLSIPIGPVPVTGQTLALPLIVALLGTRQSVLAMLAYLGEGAIGMPVFAGGSAGVLPLVGHTAGYLWSYPLAAGVIGALYDLGAAKNYALRWLAILCGEMVIFGLGARHLASFVGWPSAIAFGVVPFLVGDLAKVTIAAGASSLWPRLKSALDL